MLCHREYVILDPEDLARLFGAPRTGNGQSVQIKLYLLDSQRLGREDKSPDAEFNHWFQIPRKIRITEIRPASEAEAASSNCISVRGVHVIEAVGRTIVIEDPQVSGMVDLETHEARLAVPGTPECDPLGAAQ